MEKSRIIIPQGRTVREVVIEIDDKGLGTLKAHDVLPNGQRLPMHPWACIQIMTQMLSSTVSSLSSQPQEGGPTNGKTEEISSDQA